MTPELTALTAAALLQVIQFALMSITANLDVGTGKTMSPRDPGRLGGAVNELLSEKPGRLYRAFNKLWSRIASNHFTNSGSVFPENCSTALCADKQVC